MKRSIKKSLNVLFAVGLMLTLMFGANKQAHALSFDTTELLSGSASFSAPGVGATLYYAVYSAVPASYAAVTGLSLSAGELLYAYELYNTGSSTLTFLDIGNPYGFPITPFAALGPVACLPSTLACESSPGGTLALPFDFGTSVGTIFYPSGLVSGANSTLFGYIAGGGSPGLVTASITGGGYSGSAPVPAPVPEPATMTLLGSGLAAIGLWRRQKLNQKLDA